MATPFVHWLEYSAVVAFVASVLVVAIGWCVGNAFANPDTTQRRSSRAIPSLLIGLAVFVLEIVLLLVALEFIHFGLAVGVAFAVSAFPFCVWQARRTATALPRELIDAARLEGCSAGQLRRLVTFPLTGGRFAAAALFSLMTAWSLFAIVPVAAENPRILGFHEEPLSFGRTETLLVSIPLLVLFLLFVFFSSRRSALPHES